MNKRTLFLSMFFLCLVCKCLYSQSPANDPTWAKNSDLSDDFTTLDCAGGGVYYLTNFGTPSWTFAVTSNTGWHGVGTHTDGVTSLALNGSNLFAGTSTAMGSNGGCYKSSSGGTWSKLATGGGGTQYFVTSIATSGSNIYVGLEGCISYYNGSTWTQLTPNSSIPNNDITSIAINGSNIYAGIYGANGGVYLYNGSSWTAINTGLSNTMVTSLLFISGTSLVAGTQGGGVFYTSNNGSSWTSINGTGLTNLQITTLFLDGTTLIAGTNGGIFYSSNYSTGSPTWTSANSAGLTNLSITSLAIITSGSKLVAGTIGGGVFYSTNYSSGTPTWTTINGTGGGALPSVSVSSLVYDGSSKLYVGVCPKWRVFDICGAGDAYDGYDPSDVSITNSILDLKDESVVSCYSNYFKCGGVETYNAKYGYGYYEMYAKTPYTASSIRENFHPAFWTYSDVVGSSGRLSHQEIDIFEPGGPQYLGTTNGCGYWYNNVNRTVFDLFTYPSGYLYNLPYHKYGFEWGSNRMIFYFDDVPFYSVFNDPSFAIQALQQVQLSAEIDNFAAWPYYPPSPYATGDTLPAHFHIDYFNYYKLELNCSSTPTTMTTQSLYQSYVPSVYSTITFSPTISNPITISNAYSSVFRAVGSSSSGISITVPGTGTSPVFTVPLGTTLSLIPSPCDN